MNNERRKQIDDKIAQLGLLNDSVQELKMKAEDISSEIDEITSEEQEYLDNMPESLASGEKGSAAECAIDVMEQVSADIAGGFDDLIVVIEACMENLESAKG